jgi:hypothetical protein
MKKICEVVSGQWYSLKIPQEFVSFCVGLLDYCPILSNVKFEIANLNFFYLFQLFWPKILKDILLRVGQKFASGLGRIKLVLWIKFDNRLVMSRKLQIWLYRVHIWA